MFGLLCGMFGVEGAKLELMCQRQARAFVNTCRQRKSIRLGAGVSGECFSEN